MATPGLGHRWRLSCRAADCAWSRSIDLPSDADTAAELLVILRTHADKALHGRSIEGVAVGIDGDNVAILVLRHP